MTEFTTLFNLARDHVDAVTKSATHPACIPNALLPDFRPDPQLKSALEAFDPCQSNRSIHRHQEIVVLEAWFRNPARIDSGDGEVRARVDFLRQGTIDSILPTELWADRAPFSTDNDPAATPTEIFRLRSMNLAAIHLLFHLEEFCPSAPDATTTVSLISCLASFTDLQDKWSGLEASQQADLLLRSILRQFRVEAKKFQALIRELLEARVKPLFAKSKNMAITAQGRKAIDPVSTSYLVSEAESEAESEVKPWKSDHLYISTVLRWIVQNQDAMSIEEHWPLIIPPSLALVDDGCVTFKVKGCELLNLFLTRMPFSLLKRTGLGEVFQNALIPCLLYLPSLVSESESISTLKAAHAALFTLNHVLYPENNDRKQMMKGLDKIMRDGVFRAYAHAGENVRIAKLLIEEMTSLINEMGIETAKHLKHIVPLLSQIFSAPFATAYLPLIDSSIQALEAVIVNVWPRVAYHKGEILEGLVICWRKIEEEGKYSQELQKIQVDIQQTIKLMNAILNGSNLELAEEYQTLRNSDSRLQKLLII